MTSFIRVGFAAAAVTAMAFAAQAADMRPIYKAMPAPAPVYSWTGCYIGGQIGGQWGRWTGDVNYPGDAFGHAAIATSRGFDGDGAFLYGGQIGCNWQLGGAFVLGLEGDAVGVNRGDIGGEVYRFPVPFTGDHFNTTGRFGTQASLRAKGGFAIDRVLIYVAGGFTWAQLNATHNFFRDGDGSLAFTNSATRNGWNIGVGADFLVASNWTVGLEYRYTDYGSLNYSIPAGNNGTLAWAAFTASADNLRTQDVRLRFNYLFNTGGGPIAARY